MKLRLNMPRLFSVYIAFAALIAICSGAVHAKDDFLEPEDAFKFSATQTGPDTVRVTYKIAKGYYMYRERFEFAADQPHVKAVQAALPKGKEKHDKVFNKVMQVYRNQLSFDVKFDPASLNAGQAAKAAQAHLVITSQGCADKGLCYPPVQDKVALSAAQTSSAASTTAPSKLVKP